MALTESALREAVLAALADVAPEMDAAALDPRARFREQLDIDSMDFLNFVVGIHKRTGIEIPESDYGRLATLADAVGYLLAHPT